MIRNLLYQKITDALRANNLEKVDFALDHPTNTEFGDYTTPVALQLAKKVGQNPRKLAQQIGDSIDMGDVIEKVNIAGAGFINIWLTKKFLLQTLQKNDKHETHQIKKILLEYGQPNTHKLPHIGHLFSYVYGESLARIFEYEGHQVFRANYQGDIGLHVAKCLSQMTEADWDKVKSQPLEDQVKFLQKCYQEGSKAYEENESEKKRIQELNKKLYENDSNLVSLWQETRAKNIEYLKQLEKSLGIKYDRWFYETETGPLGKKIVEEHIGKVFEKSDGAIIFKAEKYGLHTRVFINNIGLPTYEAKDIGLYSLKKKEFPFDLSIVTIANEQVEYQKVVIKAAELIYPELVGKLAHIGFGMINLTGGKMSSRTGMIVDATGLIEEVKNKIKQDFDIKDDGLVEKITQAAIKYSFLKSDAFSNIAFDLDKSISREGDSGPYLLYTYVRCQSVLSKAAENLTLAENISLNSDEEILVRLLYRLPEVVEKSAASKSPHLIASYLFDLAQKYNFFYQKHQILKADGDTKILRLVITRSVASVLKNGLHLLGIDTVEKM